ncbi:MAG: hypothetical protein LUG95_03810 [Clostridiales bacterium]|nr:hypothetical protein [Clostridiales bacterium]
MLRIPQLHQTAKRYRSQKKTKIKKLTKKAKKSFKVTWKKISSVSGYQVQYSTDKKFSKK